MASPATIEPPVLLATLPHPLDNSRGQRWIRNVQVLGKRKRRNPEVAVATDGDSIGVYNVESPHQITSYPVPPSTKFTCKVCSIVDNYKSESSQKRYTYAAIAGEQKRIICFIESTTTSSSSEQPITKVKSIELENTKSTVIYLDVLGNSGQKYNKENIPDIIAVLESGTVISFSGNLEKELWRRELQSTHDDLFANQRTESSDDIHIDHAMLTNYEEAQSGLLAFESNLADHTSPKSPFILAVITRRTSNRQSSKRAIKLFSLEIQSIQLWGEDIPASLHQLHGADLPMPTNKPLNEMLSPSMDLDTRTGALRMCFQKSLLTYDLSSPTPRIQSELIFNDAERISFQSISSTSTMVVLDTTIRLYNTNFRSIQASLSLSEVESTKKAHSKKKRKRASINKSKSIQALSLVSSFPSIGTIIGVRGDSLVGIRTGASTGTKKRLAKSLNPSSLIYSIGNGVNSNAKTHLDEPDIQILATFGKIINRTSSRPDMSWYKFISSMDQYVECGNVEAFEKDFAERLGIYHGKLEYRGSFKQEKALINGIDHKNASNNQGQSTNGVGRRDQQLSSEDRNFSRPTSRTWSPKQEGLREEIPLAEYAIKKIFSWKSTSREIGNILDSEQTSNIEVVFFPPNVFNWVMRSGTLSLPRIYQIIQGRDIIQNGVSGHLSVSLAAVDPEMQILLEMLLSPMHLDAEELVHAINLLVDSLGYKDVSASRVKELLENRDDSLPNGDYDAIIQNEAYAADMDLDLAFSTLESGAPVREQALTCALTRLHSFSSDTIVQVLRKVLSRSSVIDIIHLLRMQLASGGWLAMYNNTFQDQEMDIDQNMSDRSILVICTFLSSALESIGMGVSAFENASVQDGEVMEDLVISLKAEISAALEGVQESIYLQGITGQLLSYSKTLPKTKRTLSSRFGSIVKPVTLSTFEEPSSILPLSLRAEEEVSLERKHPGGPSTQRTLRDVGRLKSMRVPQYSRERIQI